jgi:hypothetical protein
LNYPDIKALKCDRRHPRAGVIVAGIVVPRAAVPISAASPAGIIPRPDDAPPGTRSVPMKRWRSLALAGWARLKARLPRLERVVAIKGSRGGL